MKLGSRMLLIDIQNKLLILLLAEESSQIFLPNRHFNLDDVGAGCMGVLQLYPKRVFTDRLRTYIKLIPKKQHDTRKKNTTVIERNNLTLRTHLKRLSRKTICFSKNFEMLEATLKLYIWGYQLQF